jgi:hypothetical protein
MFDALLGVYSTVRGADSCGVTPTRIAEPYWVKLSVYVPPAAIVTVAAGVPIYMESQKTISICFVHALENSTYRRCLERMKYKSEFCMHSSRRHFELRWSQLGWPQ